MSQQPVSDWATSNVRSFGQRSGRISAVKFSVNCAKLDYTLTRSAVYVRPRVDVLNTNSDILCILLCRNYGPGIINKLIYGEFSGGGPGLRAIRCVINVAAANSTSAAVNRTIMGFYGVPFPRGPRRNAFRSSGFVPGFWFAHPFFFFQVKVMLRVAEPPSGSAADAGGGTNGFFSLDKRKKQVTLIDPSACGNSSAAPEDRRVAVAAPKMFAFDAIFSHDDSQVSFLWTK